jgi:hypothetical protein
MADKEGKKREGRHVLDGLLVQAFLVGATWEQAAQHAKCSQSTVLRRMKNAAFRRKLREARNALVTRTVDRLSTLALQAAATLGELLHSQHEGYRIAAAKTLLESAFSARKVEELEARIAALEGGDDDDGKEPLGLIA